MNLKLDTPNDCPLCTSGEHFSTCNVITNLKCEGYDDSYPNECPILDDVVLVERGGK